MLVDYEIRWSEWDSQLYLPPTMWDWEDHTQKKYKKRRDLAILISDESEVAQWDKRPGIIAEVPTSEAATADPEDTGTYLAAVPPPGLSGDPTQDKDKDRNRNAECECEIRSKHECEMQNAKCMVYGFHFHVCTCI
jgi:hypothetical protein